MECYCGDKTSLGYARVWCCENRFNNYFIKNKNNDHNKQILKINKMVKKY